MILFDTFPAPLRLAPELFATIESVMKFDPEPLSRETPAEFSVTVDRTRLNGDELPVDVLMAIPAPPPKLFETVLFVIVSGPLR